MSLFTDAYARSQQQAQRMNSANHTAALNDVLASLARCCAVIGTIEDDEHWKARDEARRILLAHGLPDPHSWLGTP